MASNADLIIRLRADQQELRKDLARAKSQMQRFNGQMRGIGQQIRGTIAASFGFTALAFALGSSIRKIADFEFQMKKVQAITGDFAGKDIPLLIANAKELGRTTRFTATEIGKLQEVLARRGFGTQEILSSTDAIRKLATIADTDLSMAAGVLAGTLRSFNLEAEESGRVANVMAESFSKSALDAEKFQVAMANVGATANAAGFSLEETTSLIAQLVDANIDASKAGTDLRKIFVSIAQEGTTLDEELIKLKNSEEKLTTSFKQFGQRALTSGIILSENRDKHIELTEALSDTNIELQDQVDIFEDSLNQQWKEFTSSIDGLILKGGSLDTFFRNILQGLTDVSNALQNLPLLIDVLFKDFKDLTDSEIVQLVDLGMITESGERVKDLLAPILTIPKKQAIKNFKELSEGIANALTLSGESYEDALQLLKAFKNEFTKEIIDAEFNKKIKKIDPPEVKVKEVKESKKFTGADIFTPISKGAEDQVKILGDLDVALNKIPDDYLKLSEASQAFVDDFIMTNEVLTATVEQTLENLIGAFTDALFSGGNPMETLLKVIGNGLQTLGKALVAMGVALKAFNLALSPEAKITAGIAAIAAGALVKNAASGLASTAGGGGGSFGGGGFAGSATGQSIQLNGQFIIRGEDLAFVLDQHNQNSGRRQGG